MDFKRVVVLFVFSFIFFSSCNKQNNTEPKITVFQSCEINDNILLVKLKNSQDKPIGEINYAEIYKGGFIPDEVIYDENRNAVRDIEMHNETKYHDYDCLKENLASELDKRIDDERTIKGIKDKSIKILELDAKIKY